MGVGVSQVKPSNCFRRLEKLVLPSVFNTSFILDDVKLAELSNNSFESKNVTFYGVKTNFKTFRFRISKFLLFRISKLFDFGFQNFFSKNAGPSYASVID